MFVSPDVYMKSPNAWCWLSFCLKLCVWQAECLWISLSTCKPLFGGFLFKAACPRRLLKVPALLLICRGFIGIVRSQINVRSLSCMIKLIEKILLYAFDSQIVLWSENAVSNSIAQKIFMGAHFLSVCVLDPRLISWTYFPHRWDLRGERDGSVGKSTGFS